MDTKHGIYVNCLHYLKIVSEIWVMHGKLQFAVSRASFIFQVLDPDAGSSKQRWNLVSTSCTKSRIAIKSNKELKIRKHEHKTAYVDSPPPSLYP